MVAYNLRKVENRDRYPDPPLFFVHPVGRLCRAVEHVVFFGKSSKKKEWLPRLGIAPRLPRPQRGVLLLYYLGTLRTVRVTGDGGKISSVLVPCTRSAAATLAKRLMRLPRKQKVVSSNLTGGSFCPLAFVGFVLLLLV